VSDFISIALNKGVNMNSEVKKVWIDALRSGDYDQGLGQLHTMQNDIHAYCCLGVLCDLAIKSGIELEVKYDSTWENGPKMFIYDGESGYLPEVVQQWAELDEVNPIIFIENICNTEEEIYSICNRIGDSENMLQEDLTYLISEFNDNGFSFEEIANIIDKTL
jgi:hypothetical protein